jgi:hypothetical protein
MRVLEGIAGRRPTALEEAYQVFRLERQGNLVAPRTLEFYDRRVGELIAWLRSEAPTVERVEDVGVNHLRARTHSSAICSGWSRLRPTTLSAGPVVGYIERNAQNSGNLADLGEGSQAPQGVGLPSTLRALSVAVRRGTPQVPGQRGGRQPMGQRHGLGSFQGWITPAKTCLSGHAGRQGSIISA